MTQITRTWSVPTSPRNPYKLAKELELLLSFEGKVWNKQTQLEYAKLLQSIDSFEGKVSAKYSDFSARDRINRAQKTFGFVSFDRNRIIKITDAGRKLIRGVRLEELFLRQLLKWQYPSANHDGYNYETSFSIKPFLEVLRIARELDGVTKIELALFCVPLIKHSNTKQVIGNINMFRKNLAKISLSIDKKKFVKDTFRTRFSSIYRSDINDGNTFVREGKTDSTPEDFIKTKIRNAKDYADAAIRYFRATGLFTISTCTYRLMLKSDKVPFIDSVLLNISREPASYKEDSSAFLDYLGNSSLPVIPQDDKVVITKEIRLIVDNYVTQNISLEEASLKKINILDKLSLEDLKDLREYLSVQLELDVLKKEQESLRNYSNLDNIINVFKKIGDRYSDEIPDKPLFLEWNIWRSLSLLNDGVIQGNLKIDSNGSPVNMAVGGFPDVECYYKDFVLVVEVTLSKGQRQYETEGEPVPRHIGQVVARLRQKNDLRPVFGLFVAGSLNSSVIAHFFVLRRTEVQYYGGKAKIIPLSIEQFVQMLRHAGSIGGVNAIDMYNFMKWADREAESAKDEQDWHAKIAERISDWTKVAI
jgi:hypothetical protein